MAHAAQIRTEEEAKEANWPCQWCEYGEILHETREYCSTCRKLEHDSKPTWFQIASTPR